MKKKLIIGAIFLSTLSFTFSAFSNDYEVIDDGNEVHCKCKISGGACKANGWGATCTTVTEMCWEYDQNC
ncbi:MAG: hypothetical protein ACLFVR_00300 [Thiohalospira sp.]